MRGRPAPGRTIRSSRAGAGAGDQGRSSSAPRSLASVKPCRRSRSGRRRPSRASAVSSNTNFALQPSGAVSALTTTSARAQSSSNARRSRTIERLALGQLGDAAEPVAGRVGARALGGIAPVAVGGEPLLGGEGVEALADDLERAVGVAHRRQIAGRRDDHVVARPVGAPTRPISGDGNGARRGTSRSARWSR